MHALNESAFLVELVAGIFFLAASVPLLRLARRSGMLFERVLGAVFLLTGLAYGFYQAPLAIPGLAAYWTPLQFAGRFTFDASVFALALFMYRTVGVPWTRLLITASGVLLASGVALSGLEGDWEGINPLNTRGYWLELLGQSLCFGWVSAWGFVEYRRARARLRIRLSDPSVSNRMFLWGLFGLLKLGTVILYLPMNIGYQRDGRYSGSMDAMMGGLEILTVCVVWLAFFPPVLYRRWLAAARPAARHST